MARPIITAFASNQLMRTQVANGAYTEALQTLSHMHCSSIYPDNFTFPIALKACTQSQPILLKQGKQIHGLLTSLGFHSDVYTANALGGRAMHGYVVRQGYRIETISTKPFVENSLIDMYMESSSLISSEKVFRGMAMDKRDIVTWTTMISGYMQYKLHDLALSTFCSMIQQYGNVSLDPVMLATVMPAIRCPIMGKGLHCFALKSGYDPYNVFVATSVLHMYAELGMIESAVKQFERIEEKNEVAWTAMIMAYAKHGLSEESLRLFNDMQKQGCVRPNHLTFMAVLITCTHSGLVDQAHEYFTCMSQEYGLTPDTYHYAAMVDVLGRAGRVREALKFIKAMPVNPSAQVWGSLLASCGLHQEMKLGHEVAKIVVRLEPDNPGNFVHLSNMLAQSRRWDDAYVVRETIKKCGLKKEPGYSSVHVQ